MLRSVTAICCKSSSPALAGIRVMLRQTIMKGKVQYFAYISRYFCNVTLLGNGNMLQLLIACISRYSCNVPVFANK